MDNGEDEGRDLEENVFSLEELSEMSGVLHFGERYASIYAGKIIEHYSRSTDGFYRIDFISPSPRRR